MAPLPRTLNLVGRASSRWLVLLAPLVLWSVGCETLHHSKPVAALPPTGQAAEVMAMWNSNVVFAPDPANNGRSTPALTGRVYLFDKDTDGVVVVDGMMTVALYEEHPQLGPDGAPIPLEIWKITPECLKLSARKDNGVGWGYSIGLPWTTYRQDIGRIQLQVMFKPTKDGMPLYRDSGLLTLQNNGSNSQTAAQANASHQAMPPITGSGVTLASGYAAPGFTPANLNVQQATTQVTTGYGPQGQSFGNAPSPSGLIQVNAGGKPQ